MSIESKDNGIQMKDGLPVKQGLYDPRFEHDACGVGFVVHVKGEQSNSIVRNASDSAAQSGPSRRSRG